MNMTNSGLYYLWNVPVEAADYTNNTTSLDVNGSSRSLIDHHFAYVVEIYVYVTKIYAFLSFTLNAIVFITYLRIVSKRRYTIPNLMFWIQSLVDIILTLAMFIVGLILEENILELTPSSTTFFLGMVFMNGFSDYLVILMLLFITMERFLLFQFPFWHQTKVSTRRILVAVFITASLSTIPATIYITHNPPTFAEWASMTRHFYIAHGVFSLLIILTVFSILIASYFTIKKSITSRISCVEDGTIAAKVNKPRIVVRERKRHLRIVFILLFMCTMYTLTYIPFIVTAILSRFIILPVEVRASRLAIYYTSTLTNPLVTLFFKEDYRYTLKGFWKTAKRIIKNSNKTNDKHNKSLRTEFEITAV